jgi:hypothetical protein
MQVNIYIYIGGQCECRPHRLALDLALGYL